MEVLRFGSFEDRDREPPVHVIGGFIAVDGTECRNRRAQLQATCMAHALMQDSMHADASDCTFRTFLFCTMPMPNPSHREGPVRSSPGFRTHRTMPALAEQLRNQHSTLEWPQTRPLTNELNKLNRGSTGWWIRRPAHAAHLAKLLNTELDDLGLGARSPVITNFDFPGFFGMPPVDLRRDTLWDLGGARLLHAESESNPHLVSLEEWLAPSPLQWRPPCEWHWLCIDDELERHALARRLEVKGRWDIVRADTLESVADRLAQTSPLIVVVHTLQPEPDTAVLATRPDGAGLLVVAPMLLPLRTATASPHEDIGWERLGMSPAQRAAFDLSRPGEGLHGRTMRRWTWQRPPQWRTAFLQWVERHFIRTGKDSLYSAEGMQGWLERFDPQEEWFSTPSDLLAICLGFKSEKELPQRNEAQAGRRLAAVLDRSRPGLAAEAFNAICIARWRDMGTAWEGGLPLEAWQGLVPAQPSAPSEEEWNAMLEGRTVAQRKALKAAWQQRRRIADPQWLTDNSFLAVKEGGHDFQHRAVASLRIRDVLMADMQQASTAEWAQACFDPQRCRVVEAALDALSMAELGALSDRLVQPDAITLESLGAAEAVFCALGRKIARQGVEQGFADRFAPLVRQVVGRLDLECADWALPAPWSRPTRTRAQQLEWITVCWAWSLVPMEAGPAGQWLFPGWSGDALLPAAPSWLSDLWPEEATTALPPAWALFFGVVDAWVREVSQPQPEAPRLLHIAYLAEAGRGAWGAQAAWWEGIDSPGDLDWVDAMLIARLDKASAPQRLWNAYVSAEVAAIRKQRFAMYSWQRRHVRRWLLESASASPATLIEALDAEGLRYLAAVPHTLPPAMRGPLLRRFCTLLSGQCFEFEPAWLDRFGPPAAEVVEQLLIADGALAWELGPVLWKWTPERAARLLTAPDSGLPGPCRSILVDCCPAAHRPWVVDALRMQPDLLSSDALRSWVRAVLPGSGALAVRLVPLLDSGHVADIQA